MTTLTFDTLKFANKLKAAGILPEHAEAEAEALAEILDINLKELATKQDLVLVKKDLHEVELRLKAEIAETKSELIRWVVGIGFLQTTLIVGIVMKAAHLL